MNSSSNSSVLRVQSEKHIDLVYIVAGFSLVFANGPILLAILRYSLRRRKEYVVLAGLAGADVVVGLSTLCAGFHRLHLNLHPEQIVLVSKWQCFLQPHVLLGVSSVPLQSMLFSIVSLDRLLTVCLPIWHALSGPATNIAIVLSAYCLSALIVVAQTLLLLPHRQPRISSYCFTGQTYDNVGYVGHQVIIRMGSALLSVVLYLFVPVAFNRQSSSIFDQPGMQEGELRKYWVRQKRLNTTVGLSCLSTTVFYLLPQGSVALSKLLFGRIPFYYSYVWPLCCLNSFLNGFIYVIRHRDIRDALCSLFRCETERLLLSRRSRRTSLNASRLRLRASCGDIRLRAKERQESTAVVLD